MSGAASFCAHGLTDSLTRGTRLDKFRLPHYTAVVPLESLEERGANLEGRVEEHHGLFGRLETRLQTIESRLNHLDAKIDEKIGRLDEKLDSKFATVYTLMAAAWVTIILALAALFFKYK
jgi:hypothetical protein